MECRSQDKPPVDEFRQYGGNTPFFTLNGTSCWGRITNLYDGDTFKVVIKLFDTYYKFNVRMYGIDTCEIKSKEEENKKKAIMARNRILQLICKDDINLEKAYTKKEIDNILENNVCMVWLNCMEFDKYGRLLARVSKTPDSKETLTQTLIKEKLGYEYFGDTKFTEDQQMII
jgi:endonuclease YncB( thermonuclease family)